MGDGAPTTTDPAPPRGGRFAKHQKVIGGASAAMTSQGVVAGSSFALQALALHELHAVGLGVYTILANGLLVTATALHTGWIGDPLVLLDRHEPRIRRALVATSGFSAVLSFLFGLVGAVVFAGLGVRSAALFGLATVLWLVEETGRRLLMARLEFAKLVANDVAYAVAALGVAGVITFGSRLTMDWLVFAMACGSAASIVVVVFQLPRHELALPARGSIAYRELADVSTWRSGQLMMRPLGMLMVRVAVASIVSKAALGLMESGRLLTAPILTAANGFGGFTLPFFTRKRDEGDLRMPTVMAFAAVSALGAALYIPVAFLLAPSFERWTDSPTLPTALIVSWCLYTMAYAANIPIVNALTALMFSRTVFWGRVVDSIVIVIAAVIVVEVDGINWVPTAMTFGLVLGTALPFVVLRRNGSLAR
ncbi:MAG: hypothetical protein U0Q22_03030 [Acidimicrobiales bacterium]